MLTLALATIGADLAIDAARKGQRDEAIDELRASFSLHMVSGSRVFVGCTGEALVKLLIDRGSIDDLTEAHRIVDQWQAQRPGIPALDLWWLKSRALLAKAEGDSDGYAELAKQYLALCEKLDARGRLDEARRMVERMKRWQRYWPIPRPHSVICCRSARCCQSCPAVATRSTCAHCPPV